MDNNIYSIGRSLSNIVTQAVNQSVQWKSHILTSMKSVGSAMQENQPWAIGVTLGAGLTIFIVAYKIALKSEQWLFRNHNPRLEFYSIKRAVEIIPLGTTLSLGIYGLFKLIHVPLNNKAFAFTTCTAMLIKSLYRGFKDGDLNVNNDNVDEGDDNEDSNIAPPILPNESSQAVELQTTDLKQDNSIIENGDHGDLNVNNSNMDDNEDSSNESIARILPNENNQAIELQTRNLNQDNSIIEDSDQSEDEGEGKSLLRKWHKDSEELDASFVDNGNMDDNEDSSNESIARILPNENNQAIELQTRNLNQDNSIIEDSDQSEDEGEGKSLLRKWHKDSEELDASFVDNGNMDDNEDSSNESIARILPNENNQAIELQTRNLNQDNSIIEDSDQSEDEGKGKRRRIRSTCSR